MVRKALLVAAGLFTLYAIFISRVRPYWSVSQHQWQDNQIKGEKFIYGSQRAQRVLVGSSLACRLDSLPGVYNLALGGKSLLDGLAIVTQQHRRLRTVYVEMNFVDREEDENFTQAMNNPVLVASKRLVMALRADKQPLGVVGQHVQMLLEPLLFRLYSPAAVSRAGLAGQLLGDEMQKYSQPPAPALMQKQFSKLQADVAVLERRGVQVVFFEMPLDVHLCDSPRAIAIRTAFKSYFPEHTYRYVGVPDCGKYQTTDGVHLNAASATEYTSYLQAQI